MVNLKGRLHEPNGNYTASCIKCGTAEYIMMVPHRDADGWLVGWVFVCVECKDKVLGSTIRLDIKEVDNENKK